MHRDDRERDSKYWRDDVGQRSPGERGYEEYPGGEHAGGFYGQESAFGRGQRGRDQYGGRGREQGGDYERRSYGGEERGGYDRWAGPERGRQGYPGSMAERFGPNDYDRERIEGRGFGRGNLERQDYDRRELGRREYERHGYGGGQVGGGDRFSEPDREPDRRYGQDRGRQYGEQGFDQGGYGFQSPEQRPYDQGRSQGRGYDEGRYGPGFYDRDRRTDQTFEGRAGGGREWNERPNQYGQEHYGGSTHDADRGYRPPERYGVPMSRDDDRGRRGWDDEDRRRSGDQSRAQGGYGQEQSYRQGHSDRQQTDTHQYGQPNYARNWGPANENWRENWRSGGSHAGRGPRGYQRSDDRIRDEVCEVLTRHPDIDASDVDIDVRGGEVTLRGMVDSRRTRRLAEDVVENLPGVRDVHNELRSSDRTRAGGGDGMRGSVGDPSRSGASGSDTGKVEVTGDEEGSTHQTPDARDAASGSTPIGHTYEGAGMMGTGGVDSMTWTGVGDGHQRTGTGGGVGGGSAGSGVMNPGADVGGMPFGMATGSDLGSLGNTGQRGTGDIGGGRTGDLGGMVGAAGSDAMGVGTSGGGQVGASSAVGTDPETVSSAGGGGMLSGGSGAVGTDGGEAAGARGSSRSTRTSRSRGGPGSSGPTQ